MGAGGREEMIDADVWCVMWVVSCDDDVVCVWYQKTKKINKKYLVPTLIERDDNNTDEGEVMLCVCDIKKNKKNKKYLSYLHS